MWQLSSVEPPVVRRQDGGGVVARYRGPLVAELGGRDGPGPAAGPVEPGAAEEPESERVGGGESRAETLAVRVERVQLAPSLRRPHRHRRRRPRRTAPPGWRTIRRAPSSGAGTTS